VDGADSGSSGNRKKTPQWLIPGVAIACFALGVIVGVMASMVQASDAGQATIDAQRAQAQVIEEREDLKAQREDIEADKAALVQREADVAARETAASQKEAELVQAQDQLTQQQNQQNQQPQQDEQARGGGGDGFRTCDELRAQGIQTPIKKGDPGYSHYLDLDGNRFACE
jgi:hypothetical protein